MFRCQITQKMSKPGEAQHKVVISKRPKDYYSWRLLDEEDEDYSWVKVSDGWEIAQELSATEEGIALWDSWDDTTKAAFVKDLNKTSEKKEVVRRVVR